MEQQYAQTRRARVLDTHERHLAAAGGVYHADLELVRRDTARELGISEADVSSVLHHEHIKFLGAG